MGLIASIIFGLLAGWITSKLMKGNYNLITTLILGILGSFVGGWLSSILLGVDMVTGFNLTSLVFSVIGAVVLVAVYRLLTRRPIAS
jgi:uncharacterized membrane protein YeaQ/YmgE (transglycosylase-associated protein family)